MPVILLLSQVGGPWPMWGGDVRHTGLQTMRGAITSPVIKWRFAPGDWTESQFSAIADCDGDGYPEVIMGSDDAKVYCLRGSDGSLKWSLTTGYLVEASPAVGDCDGDGKPEVVFGSWDSKIYCVRGSDGGLKWSFSTGNITTSSPAIADIDRDGKNEVVVGSDDGKMYCLRGSDGGLIWSFSTGGWVWSSPALADCDNDGKAEIFFGSLDGKVYSLSPGGALRWSYATGDKVRSSPAIQDLDGDGHLEVVIGSDDDLVYCFDARLGSLKWSFTTGSDVRSSPVLADVNGDKTVDVIIGSWDGNVYCLAGSNGAQLWAYNAGQRIRTPGAIFDADGDGIFDFLVSSSEDSLLRCIKAIDGSLLWNIKLGYAVHSPFAGDIDGDGCGEIVAGTWDPDPQGYRIFAIDDPYGASDCGFTRISEEMIDPEPHVRIEGQTLHFYLPISMRVSISVYEPVGRLVQKLPESTLSEGEHTFTLALEKRGLYVVVIKAGEKWFSIKMCR